MSNTSRLIRATLALVAFAAATPAQGQGLGNWVFTPYVGAYVPTGDLTRFSGTEGTELITGKVKHDNAVALGGTLSYWFAERMGVEFGGAYSWSDADIRGVADVPGASVNEHSFVMLGNAKLMFALLPTTSNMQLRFGLGPAIINRGGSAYKDDEGKFTGLTTFGGAASLCTRIPLTGRLALRLRAEDFIYQPRLRFKDSIDPSSNPSFGRRTQNDLILSAGLQIGFAR